MAVCPKCQAKFDSSELLATCPSCGALVPLNMQGEFEEPPVPSANFQDLSQAAEQTPAVDAFNAKEINEPSNQEVGFHFNFQNEQELESSQTAPLQNTEIENNQSSFDNNMSSNDLQDFAITDYANSQISGAQSGAFVYNIKISDIDSKEIKDMLLEALDDSRFGWDAHVLVSQIKSGELMLNQISAVKSSVLVSRLKSLPLQVSWQQVPVVMS